MALPAHLDAQVDQEAARLRDVADEYALDLHDDRVALALVVAAGFMHEITTQGRKIDVLVAVNALHRPYMDLHRG